MGDASDNMADAEMKDGFALFDKQGDGNIEASQIGDVMRAFGLNPTNADIKKSVDGVDPEGKKRIGYNRFLPVYETFKKATTPMTFEDYVEGMKVFDRDCVGYLSSGELRHLLTCMGEKLVDDEVTAIFAGNEDANGNVQYDDLIKKLMKD